MVLCFHAGGRVEVVVWDIYWDLCNEAILPAKVSLEMLLFICRLTRCVARG